MSKIVSGVDDNAQDIEDIDSHSFINDSWWFNAFSARYVISITIVIIYAFAYD